MNRYILLVLHIASLVLLGFGWVLDILHIEISVHYIVDFNLFSEKRSVLGMLEKLWNDANYWPFTLIFLFGIIVPLIKSGLLFYILLAKNPDTKWQRFVSAISKYADGKNIGHSPFADGTYKTLPFRIGVFSQQNIKKKT